MFWKLNALTQKLKTRVVKNNVNPEWNEDLTLSISDSNLPIKLVSITKKQYKKANEVTIYTTYEKLRIYFEIAYENLALMLTADSLWQRHIQSRWQNGRCRILPHSIFGSSKDAIGRPPKWNHCHENTAKQGELPCWREPHCLDWW